MVVKAAEGAFLIEDGDDSLFGRLVPDRRSYRSQYSVSTIVCRVTQDDFWLPLSARRVIGEEQKSLLSNCSSTGIGTITHVVPVASPFLPPGERSLADGTDFCGKVVLGRSCGYAALASAHDPLSSRCDRAITRHAGCISFQSDEGTCLCLVRLPEDF